MADTIDDTEAFNIALAGAAVNCDDPTTHFPRGCDLLLYYDLDGDGAISGGSEIGKAQDDFNAGIITQAELDFIMAAWTAGSINALCPGCYAQAAVTCTDPTPHFANGCALLLQYDADNDGKLTAADALRAGTEGMTDAEVQFILVASAAGSINTICPGCYAPSAEAKGQIVNLDYPSSVQHGAQFDVDASTKNTGGASGQFRMELWIDGAKKRTSEYFTLAAGATSTDKITVADAPTSGASMSCVVKCIRIT